MIQQELFRLSPRISANKLGEYLVSPPLRRRDILEQQKYPRTFIGAYYEPARRAIVDFVVGAIDRVQLLSRADRLVSAEHDSDWFRHRAHGCAEAIMRFLDLEPHMDMRGMTPVHVPKHEIINVHGVDISVYPDLVLEGRDARGRPLVGAIKLHFPKSHPHTEASAQFVATLLRVYAMTAMTARGRTLFDACLVVDVFSGRVMTAPRGYKRRWRDISAGCEEIRNAWATT
ncbi:MAG: hypothetical protein AAGF11_22540 [Myxococcota bacterium]